MRYLVYHSLKYILSIGLFVCTNTCFAQLGGYPDSINGLDLLQSVTKEMMIAALGDPVSYKMSDYTDEGLGIDEIYKYGTEDRGLEIKFIMTGELDYFICNSPDYLLYGNLRVGGDVAVARKMISNGFGQLPLTKQNEDGSETIILKLGDNTLYITYKEGKITLLSYEALF